MSEARGLGRDTLWYGAANVASGLLGVVSLAVFARLLTPAELGVYYLILSASSVINSLACAWINQTVKRYYPELTDDARAEFLGRVLAAYLLTAAGLLALGLLAMLLLPRFGLSAHLPWPVLGLTFGTAAVFYVQWLYTIRRQPRACAINQLAYNALRLGLGWLLITAVARRGEALSWGVGLAGLLAALWGWLRLREKTVLTRASFSRGALASLAAYGLPLALVNGGGWLLNTAGRVILAPLAGLAAAGLYSAAQQLAQQLVALAVQPLITASDALAIRLHAREGAAATVRFLSQLFGVSVLVGSGVCLTLSLLAGPVEQVVLGPGYAGSGRLFMYFAPAMLLWLLTPVLIKSQEIGERLGELPWLMLGAGGLNIALNFLLIPRYGAFGAAVATLIANAALSVASYQRGRRHLPWPLPRRWLALSAVGLLALAGADYLLPPPAGVLAVALCFTTYVLGYLGLCAGVLLIAPRAFRTELKFVQMVMSRRA